MSSVVYLIAISIVANLVNGQTSGKYLGDMCIPGMCQVLNSNCKWNGQIFKCVCKENYLSVNQTHCGLSLPATDDPSCKVCLENDSLCIDFNNDKLMDQCWCPNGCSKQKSRGSKRKGDEPRIHLIDASSNRVVADGSTVYTGEQILIHIKQDMADSEHKIAIENCSLSALTTQSVNNVIEKIVLIRRGCPKKNIFSPTNLMFRSLGNNQLESNLFQVFRLSSSSVLSLSCWIRYCTFKSKCAPRACSLPSNHDPFISNEFELNQFDDASYPDEESSDESRHEGFDYRNMAIHFIVEENPAIVETRGHGVNRYMIKSHVEETEPRQIDGLIKPIIVSVVILVFTLIVSVSSVLIYRACMRERIMFGNMRTHSETPPSECYGSDSSCKYEVNGDSAAGANSGLSRSIYNDNFYRMASKPPPSAQQSKPHHQAIRNVTRW